MNRNFPIPQQPGITAAPALACTEIRPVLFSEFVAWIDRSPKTTRSYLSNLRQFAAWMSYKEIRSPVREDVILYRDWLTSDHDAIQFDPATGWSYRLDRSGRPIRITCRPNTVAQYLRSVCQFFRWTAASGIYPDIAANIHAPKISHDNHRKEALTPSEVLEIERSITARAQESTTKAAEATKDVAGRIQRSTEQGKRLYAMFLLATNAGCRTIELSRADVQDFVTKGRRAWLYIWGKGRTEPDQKKPLAPEVAEAIRDYLKSREDIPVKNSPLFVSTGNRSGGQRMAPTTISTHLKKAMQAAGYDSDRLTAHSLRHTAGTAVQALTGDLYATQTYMRHSNPATTEIYLHTDTENREAQIAQQLYDLYHGKTSSDNGAAERLRDIVNGMDAEQLERLAAVAAAMA